MSYKSEFKPRQESDLSDEETVPKRVYRSRTKKKKPFQNNSTEDDKNESCEQEPTLTTVKCKENKDLVEECTTQNRPPTPRLLRRSLSLGRKFRNEEVLTYIDNRKRLEEQILRYETFMNETLKCYQGSYQQSETLVDEMKSLIQLLTSERDLWKVSTLYASEQHLPTLVNSTQLYSYSPKHNDNFRRILSMYTKQPRIPSIEFTYTRKLKRRCLRMIWVLKNTKI